MISVAYFERRMVQSEIEFEERRIRDRRNGHAPLSPERRRLATQVRRYEREKLSISVQLVVEGREVPGVTRDISPEGIMVVSELPVAVGSPMSLRFSFSDVCYLNVSGQVIFCLAGENGSTGKFGVGIKFSGVRQFEQDVLASAIEEFKRKGAPESNSFLTIAVSKDALALEAAKIASPVSPRQTQKQGAKGRSRFTPHPSWILEMDENLAPLREAILQTGIVYGTSTGDLSLQQVRGWNIQFYPFIEAFPRFMSLNLAKASDPMTRTILIDNIRVEKKHADQWMDMAKGFGVGREEMLSTPILPEVEALTHWLWSINSQGSMAEGVSATNYSIEGITQGIAKMMVKGFDKYHGKDGVVLEKKAYWWMEAHAKYDDLHPLEALEIIKRHTDSAEMQQKVHHAAKRSLEYLLRALEACHRAYAPKFDHPG